MYKGKNNISPTPVQDIFKPSTELNLRNNNVWEIPKVRTVNNGIETIRYRGPITWELVPPKIQNSKNLSEFKVRIKEWKPQGCTCRLCKIYIHDLGFL